MKCFKCEKVMECACHAAEGDWYTPDGGVEFEGGWNFGSAIYDAMINGVHVELVICDDCLKAANGSDRMREVHTLISRVKSVPKPSQE